MWEFTRTSNKIRFAPEYINGACVVDISVQVLKDGTFKLSYENHYENENNNPNIRECHPLYQKSVQEDDEDMLTGLFVTANPISFHMIQCLMSDTSNNSVYDTGCRPFEDYCGEVMRALTEMEF